MNASLRAQSAYSMTARSTRTMQAIEYDAFARITSALQKAQTPSEQVMALHRNRELWTILAADVAGSENRLPAPLRAQIFYLAEFTSQHTSKVLRKQAKSDILVEINTSIMRGLRQQKDMDA